MDRQELTDKIEGLQIALNATIDPQTIYQIRQETKQYALEFRWLGADSWNPRKKNPRMAMPGLP